jgi:hypothetical protein
VYLRDALTVNSAGRRLSPRGGLARIIGIQFSSFAILSITAACFVHVGPASRTTMEENGEGRFPRPLLLVLQTRVGNR